ncbi:hypothetical protein ACS0TY_024027 [Phlomoides rotata]
MGCSSEGLVEYPCSTRTSSKNPGKAPIEEPPREPEKNFYLKQKESNECYVAELQKYWIYRECGMLGTFLSLTGLRESANLAFLQKHMGATCFKNLRLLGGFETLESGEMGHWWLKDENEKVPVPELMEQIASVTGVLSEQQRLICHETSDLLVCCLRCTFLALEFPTNYKLDKAWKHYAGVQRFGPSCG